MHFLSLGLQTDFIANEDSMLLQKPYTSKQLLRSVREALDRPLTNG